MKTLFGNQKWFGFTFVTLLILFLGTPGNSFGEKNVGEPRTVRLFYFLPNDRPYRQEVVDAMKTGIVEIQSFYAEQMEAHGHGRKTFQIETDAQGNPIVHRVDGEYSANHYSNSPLELNEIEQAFDISANVILVVRDITASGSRGRAADLGKNNGIAEIDEWDWFTAAHELGHAFDLNHDFRDRTYIMSYGRANRSSARLSACAAEFLATHPYFNPAISLEDGTPPTIELISPTTYPAGSESVPIRLRLNDSDGLHQVILLVPSGDILIGFNSPEVKACRGLRSENNSVIEFDYDGVIPSSSETSLFNPAVHKFSVMAVDTDGNTHKEEFSLRPETWEYQIATLEGHEKVSPNHDWITYEVYSVAFSPDGTTLASASDDGTVKLWNVNTRTNITTFGHRSDSVAFSPDGTTLASGGGNTVKLWDIASQTNIATFTGHSARIPSLAFSPNGTILASGSRDDTVKLWDVATQTFITTLQGHTSDVNSVAFSPDGTILASGSADSTVKLWDVATLINIATLVDDRSIHSIAFSPDGTTLAAGATDKTVRLWDLATREKITRIGWPRPGVLSSHAVAFSPDGSILAAMAHWSYNEIYSVTDINLFDMTPPGREIVATLSGQRTFTSVAFSPDGTILASGHRDATIKLWDTSEWAGTPVINHPPTGAVTISGTAAVGETLNADVSAVMDPDGPLTLEFSYQWLADGFPIVGATSETYTLTENDIGKRIRVRASYIDGLGAPVNVTSRQTQFGEGNGITPPLSDRTPQVRDAIVNQAGVYSVDDLTQAHLAAMPSINLSQKSITSLKSDDFAGLTGLTTINLSRNDLSSLPADIFDGLTELTEINLENNDLTTLPADIFESLTGLTEINLGNNDLTTLPADIFESLTGLTEINLNYNDLTTLPADIFEGLTALTSINLYNNDLTTLPDGIFDGLTALTEINLNGNDLSSLPADIFDGLTALERIRILLGGNDLTTLPDGIFEGLTGLTWLHLWGNAVDPISLTVSLEKVGNDQFKAVAPAGAPFNMMLPITVTSGSITGGIATLTIPAGAVESEVLTVTRAPDTTYAVSVNIGTLPRLPINHSGYSLVKSNDLPLVFAELGGSVLVPVSERTPQVRDAIVRAAGVNSAADVTEAHLAAITELNLYRKNITSLKKGDFDGLSALTHLYLWSNQLTSLPEGVFNGLSALTDIYLYFNQLTSLPEDVFNGLSTLTHLFLNHNDLTSLPEGVFNGLSALTNLALHNNDLTSLPEGVFNGLSTLKYLSLSGNAVNLLPIPISLEKIGDGQFNAVVPTGAPFDGDNQFKAVVPTGAPFDIVLPIRFTNGILYGRTSTTGPEIVTVTELLDSADDDGTTTLTIPAGRVESNKLIVTRAPDTTGAVTVNIGTLPSLPSDHSGYALVKSTDLPLSYALPEVRSLIGSRTPQVRDAIIAAVPGVDNAADVTETHLAAIESLTLDTNGALYLREDDFSGLSSLMTLEFRNNGVLTLPEGVFTGLSSLTALRLFNNGVLTLPEGVFTGLSSLTTLEMRRRTLTVTLTKVGEGQFKAVAPTGAPFDIVLPISVTNGSISGGATTVTIPKGSVESEVLTVTRVSGASFAVSVDIGTLPGLPADHTGYTLVKSADLPLTFPELGGRVLTPVSERTPEVRDAIIASVRGVDNAADVTEAHLAAITALDVDLSDSVKVGDFEGLTGLTTLGLDTGQLTSLPAGLFNDLSNVTYMDMYGEQLTTLPVGAFDGLTSLDTLILTASQLTSLPAGVFDPLTSLIGAEIRAEQLNTLPANIFDQLTNLTYLLFYGGKLNTLPDDVFDQLTKLTTLLLFSDRLTSLPDGVLDELTQLTSLRIGRTQLTSLPDGMLSGLSSLTSLDLSGNAVDPMPLTVSLEKVGTDQFKAVAPAGAPFAIVLPLTVTNGSINGGATTVTIPVGSVESDTLTISGTTSAVTVNIGTLPGLPTDTRSNGIRLHKGYVLAKSETLPIVFTNLDGGVLTPVSERTPQVQNAILNKLPDIDSVDDVTKAHLATITGLGLGTFSILGSQSDPAIAGATALHPGDFDGLTSLTTLAILEEHLSSIPAGVFDELVSLETLLLLGSFNSLPDGVFDGMPALTVLIMGSTQLNSLPMGVFDELSNLTKLGLVSPLTSLPEDIFDELTALRELFLVTQLSSLPEDIFGDLTALIDFNLSETLGGLPAGIFDNLTALTDLYLGDNQLTSLPTGIFDGLTALTKLNLDNNQLTGLPEGVFSGLSSLTALNLSGNAVDPLPLTVSLEKGADGQFKAVAPTGAPFDIVVPLHVQNGSITGGATNTTIPKGSTESESLTVTRTSGTTYAVTANIGNPLPALPSGHNGYTLVKSDTLPLVFTEFGGSVFTPVSERTPQVRDAIVRAIPGVNSASDVTEAHLAAITELNFGFTSIRSLTAGDFDGLTALERLNLPNDTQLSTLPAGIFDDLTALTSLNLSRIQLSTLPAGIFDNLTALTSLYLSENQLSTLPAGIFDKLTTLTTLDLAENRLSLLPAGIFDKLSTLTKLELDLNQLSTLPAGIFDNLSALTFLNLFGNQLSSLPAGIFDNLTALTSLYLSENQLSSLPAGTFDGLTALEALTLDRNAVDPLPLIVSLEQVEESQFKAVAPTGAPYDIVLPLTITNGSISSGVTTVTIPKGSVESEPLTVTRTPGENLIAIVNIGTLPSIPTEVRYNARLHQGYTLVKSDDLPLTFTAPSETTLMAIKGTITADGTPAEAGLEVTVTIGSTTKTAVSEAGGGYSVIFLSTAVVATSGDTVTVQVLNPNTGATTERTVQLSSEQIGANQATIDLQFSPSGREYLLSVPEGISLIHVPLKVTAVDGAAKTLESVGNLYDALGGATTVSLLITHDPKAERWVGYFGSGDRGSSADKVLTDDLGIIAVLTAATSVSLSGTALGTNGHSSITLHPGINLVGVPLKDLRITRVTDLFALEGIKDNVSLTLVSDNGEIKLVEQPGDSGDIPVTGGQSFILVAKSAAPVEITGVGWSNVSEPAVAPSMALTGIEVTDITPVLAVTGSIGSPVGGASLPWPVGGASLPRLGVTDFSVTVKNLSTGKMDTAMTDDDGASYRFTFVDTETGRAAQVGDILEITAHSADPLIGVHPVRHTVTVEDVKRSRIPLAELVAYEIPAKTELLLNYPNPFNPETWIPYRLAKDAFVTVTIYDPRGRVVRDIAVGHRIAAVYESRSEAIYWDGRTEYGERVASGIYFYTLTAGDYSATRKMVILK